MLAAKLLATLTILQAGLALLESERHQSIDIYIHATYFVIPEFLPQIVLALGSGFFGLVYFAASRWVSHTLNNIFRSHAFCFGGDRVCTALSVPVRARVCSGNWLNGVCGPKSLDLARGNARVAVFPVGLHDACAELRIDRDQGISASLWLAESREIVQIRT